MTLYTKFRFPPCFTKTKAAKRAEYTLIVRSYICQHISTPVIDYQFIHLSHWRLIALFVRPITLPYFSLYTSTHSCAFTRARIVAFVWSSSNFLSAYPRFAHIFGLMSWPFSLYVSNFLSFSLCQHLFIFPSVILPPHSFPYPFVCLPPTIHQSTFR